MNKWIDNLKSLINKENCIKESEILINLPTSIQTDWDNFMRGKTCPLLDNGDHGVYSSDWAQFLGKFND